VDEWVGPEDFPTTADERWLYAVNGDAPPDADSWLPINLSDLDEQPPVEPTLGSLGIVYPGKRHVFSGPQESAKTLAAYVIAIQVIRCGGGVVLIDFEMGKWDARTRLRELGATVDEIGAVAYVEPYVAATPVAIERLVARKPELVLVDAAAGAYDLQGLDDNKRGDVERFTRIFVRSFWMAGIATIVLDHVTKNAESRGNYAIGSERKVGGADVHLGFEVVHPIKRGGHGLYKIVTHKDRGGFLKRGKLAEFELSSDPDTHLITWAFKAPVEGDEDAPFRPTHLMEKVSRWLEMQARAVPIGDVKSAVEGKGTYVIDAVNMLVAEGFVDETVGARSARLLETIRAFRESDDDPFPTRSHPFPDEGLTTRSPFPSSVGGNGTDEDDGERERVESFPAGEDPGF
jgi:hypothetical protein